MSRRKLKPLSKKGNYSFNAVKAPQNDKDHYSIRYAEFVVPLVKAVQELTAKMEAQEKEINALKKQFAATGNQGSIETTNKAQGATLYQNHPNPFSTQTDIDITLPDEVNQANLIFYTLEGKQLKVLHLYNRGDFKVQIDSNDLGKGVFFYALMVDGKIIDSKRFMVSGK